MTTPITLPTSSQIRWRLHNAPRYLAGRPQKLQPALFEELVAQAFASLLHLPFYDATNDPNTGPRVTWNGDHSSYLKAPSGPDGIAHANGFTILIESTMRTGTGQWSKEFNECIRHARQTATSMNIRSSDLYTVLVTTSIHEGTYSAIKSHNQASEWKVSLVETGCLAQLVETASLVFTLRHIDCRKLIEDLLDYLAASSSWATYRNNMGSAGRSWTSAVLSLEKKTTVAIKAYQALLSSEQSHTSLSDLLVRLYADTNLGKYLKRISVELRPELVTASLRQEGLAAELRIGYTPDSILAPVPLCDFEHRNQRRLEAIRNAIKRT